MSPTTPDTNTEGVNMPTGDKTIKCHKCGAELRSEQKVCLQCGTRTIAGGNFEIHDKEPFQITPTMKKAALGAGLLILLLIIIQSLRVTPPDVVAQTWFNAMANRNYNKAERFHSNAFASEMQEGVSDTRAISDRIYDELNAKQAKAAVGEAVYTQGVPTQATVNISLTYPDYTGTVQVVLTKIGRRWMIERLVI